MLQDLKRAAAGSVLETHPGYRTAIGVLGVSLPFIVVFGGLAREVPLQPSISAYYYSKLGGWFVGTLWVIGVFLFFYKYTPRVEIKRAS